VEADMDFTKPNNNHVFPAQTTVVDACAALREKLTEIKGLGPAAQYGLFLADEDPKKGTITTQSP